MSNRYKRPVTNERKGNNKKRRWHIFALGIAAIAIVAAAIGARHYRKQPLPAPSFHSNESGPRYARLDAIIEKAKIGVRGEPDAEKLLDDFAKNAMVGKMASYGQVVFATRYTVRQETAAMFVFVSREELKLVPEQMPAYFMFAPQIQAIVFADLEPVNDETLAGVLIHELYHWRVFIRSGRKIDTEPYSYARLEEEVLAHELEIRATDRLTNGKFLKALNDAMTDKRLHRKDRTGMLALSQEGINRVMAAWPNKHLSEIEFGTRLSNAAISFHLLQLPTRQERVTAYEKIRRVAVQRDIR